LGLEGLIFIYKALIIRDALKACGGMVDFKLTSPSSPMLFSANGYQLVVMPMLTAESQSKGKPEAEAEPGQGTTVLIELAI